MTIKIIGDFDPNKLYCTGSFTKLLTTFSCLSLLAENHDLTKKLDDPHFLNEISKTKAASEFLKLFQKIVANHFSLHDICSYYAGLPYTFDVWDKEIENVEFNLPFKHHSILSEEDFLAHCQHEITPVYTNQCKFHYSEISIIFLGYLIEKIYHINIENLYQKYILKPFQLKNSVFSRNIVKNTYVKDLSNQYDYPSIAILDHGYFCYSNGFYTTLNDTKILLEGLLKIPIFKFMTDLKIARAASGRLLNGLAVEIRKVADDIIYGYEGLSFSGCNIWAYSTKNQEGILTFTENEEEAYKIYDEWGYQQFDKVSKESEMLYQAFLKKYTTLYQLELKDIPDIFQGNYKRVKINEKNLENIFKVGKNFITIRNPEDIRYEIIYVKNHYRILSKDGTHGSKVGFKQQPKSGHCYMMFDGTLYQKI